MTADPPPDDAPRSDDARGAASADPSVPADRSVPAAVEGLVRDVTAMQDGRRITYYSRSAREEAR